MVVRLAVSGITSTVNWWLSNFVTVRQAPLQHTLSPSFSRGGIFSALMVSR
jgi:hypothetical protein